MRTLTQTSILFMLLADSDALAPLSRIAPLARSWSPHAPQRFPSAEAGRSVLTRILSTQVDRIEANDAPTNGLKEITSDGVKDEKKQQPSSSMVPKGTATLPASKRLISGLSFLTGWADFALMTKYKTFATMMTGNTMWMASAFVDRRFGDIFYYASIIISYIGGLVAFRRADLRLKDKSLSRLCAPLVAALFIGADVLSWINPSNRLPSVAMLAMAFAVINSVGSEVGGTLTFVLTGHMTKLTAVGFDRVSSTAGRKRLTETDRSAAIRSMSVIGAFFAGALFGCGLFAKTPQLLRRGAFSLMGLSFGGLFLWQDRKNLGAWWLRDDEHLCELDELETTCT